MQRVWTVLVSVVCVWGAVSVRPDAVMAEERLSLWNGRAPIGDGSFEEADAWLTVHRPQQGNGTAIVICPGGGYGGLVTGAEGHGIAEWLNSHGITGAVLEYRLPAGRYRVPLLDAQRAIRTVRAHAAEWGLRTDRIGIMGFSAGGHLASTAATHFDDGDAQAKEPTDRIGCRPDFAVLIYPVVTMGKLTHGGSRNALLGKEPTAELIKEFSNEEQVTDRTPPTFLAHARDDEAVPPVHSQSLYEALKAHHVPAEYLELDGGGHGLNGYKGPYWDAWQERSLEWLAEQNLVEVGFVSLFDGQSLSGWKVQCLPKDKDFAAQAWTVESGAILANSMGHTDHFYILLSPEREYGDFVLRLRFQVEKGVTGNSGIQIRSRFNAETGWMEGPQIDISPPDPSITGKLWNEGPGEHRWLSNEPVVNGKFFYADEGIGWNDLEITAEGTRIRSVLNGVTVVDYDGSGVLDDETHRQAGVGLRGEIGLQLHSFHELKLRFKDLRIKELAPEK